MKWPVFAIFAFLAVVVQLSLRSTLTLHSIGGISPNLVGCLAVFVALFASRLSALWACWLLGLALDLAPQARYAPVHLIGPNALGFVFGCYIVLELRSMVFRRRALTIGLLTLLFLGASSMVAASILTIRGWYPGESMPLGGPLNELLQRWGVAVYSALIAVPLGWLLARTVSLWGFHSSAPRRTVR